MWKASPIEPLNFSTKELMSRPYQVISTLYHLHTFYKQNSEYDKFNVEESTIEWAKKNDLLTPPDVWLLSKLQRMIERTTETNDSCRFHESAKSIEDFDRRSESRRYRPSPWNPSPRWCPHHPHHHLAPMAARQPHPPRGHYQNL